jgi:mono/diheme cytochrome c family protein
MQKTWCTLILVFACSWLRGQDSPVSIASLQSEVKQAAALMKEKKFAACAKAVDESTTNLLKLMEKPQARDQAELKKIHSQLSRAHELLAIEGAELKELPPWEEILKRQKTNPASSRPEQPKPAAAQGNADGVSFSKDIAPWLVDQCSRCHIAKSSGGFSMANFASLMKGSKGGVVVFPGDPVGSKLVECIESGDMPRGGGQVSPANLTLLKQWVTQGAKFDGASSDLPLLSIAKTTTSQSNANAKESMPQLKLPTGKETISFSKDIAPVLTANCNGCHFEARRNEGDLNLNSFASLLKGGRSGTMIEPGKASESLLVKKLRGMAGQRMPAGGRPALSEETIASIETWINEGAVFDGGNKDAKIDQIALKAWVSTASAEELMKRRMASAQDRWKVASPKTDPVEASDEHFHVIGNVSSENAKRLLAFANAAESTIKKQFGIRSKEPLVKGGITVFALKQRYDYSEFGTMIENRSLPPDWSSHWRKQTLDSYVAIVFDKSESKIHETSLVQQITSVWIASLEGVPKWFADGVGRQALTMNAGQNDARVQSWIQRLPESMKQMDNAKKLVNGEVNDEDAATIGFAVVRFMSEPQRKRQYDTLMRGLVSGVPFDQAMAKTFGPTEPFLQQLMGKKK